MKLKKFLSSATAVIAVASVSLVAICCNKPDSDNYSEEATPINTYEYNIPQDYCRTYYEVFVRSFADSDGDGIGDLRGLIDNLDYLNDGDDSTTTDLGINGIWMMPIHQSTSYHKYDVEDYYSIDSSYGTLNDFKDLVAACDERDIWLQMDLVLNHTSNKHEWFTAAVEEAKLGLLPSDREAVNMKKYNFVYQANKPEDNETNGTWYAVPGAPNYYYLGNFSSNMPDLNLDNQDVRDEIEKIVEYWLKLGIRSFRLDAVPWAYMNKVSYSPANHEFWLWFDEMCAQKGEEIYGERYPDLAQYCYNVGEVWSGTDTVVQFYDTKMSCFNYGNAVATDKGFLGVTVGGKDAAALVSDLADMQQQILDISDAALLSNFLSGHDNNRSASSLRSDPIKIKKTAALYMLMPGNPYIYYGEEIGALGSQASGDENKRLHFNWGDDRETSDPPGANFTGSQTLGSMLDQTDDATSVLTYYRRVIQLRNRFPEIGRGVLRSLAINADGKLDDARTVLPVGSNFSGVNADNKNICAYTLTWNNETVFIAHNVGSDTISFDASEFSNYSIVGTLHADKTGNVTFSGGRLTMEAGTVAVLKVVAD